MVMAHVVFLALSVAVDDVRNKSPWQLFRGGYFQSCQALAAVARAADAQAIRSVSARDPAGRCNVALLDPAGFADRAPRTGKTWHLRIEGSSLIALAAFPSDLQVRFTAEQFGLKIG